MRERASTSLITLTSTASAALARRSPQCTRTVVVQIGEVPVILPRIEHDHIRERTKFERPPDPQLIIRVDLSDRQPWKSPRATGHTVRIGNHSKYVLTALAFRSVNPIPCVDPAIVSFESTLPAFHVLSATSWSSHMSCHACV